MKRARAALQRLRKRLYPPKVAAAAAEQEKRMRQAAEEVKGVMADLDKDLDKECKKLSAAYFEPTCASTTRRARRTSRVCSPGTSGSRGLRCVGPSRPTIRTATPGSLKWTPSGPCCARRSPSTCSSSTRVCEWMNP